MKLHDLQGDIIPVFYGLVFPRGGGDDGGNKQLVPALVLSDTGGIDLCDPEAAGIPEDRVARLFRDAYEALARYNVSPDDSKLDNWHLVGGKEQGKLMVLDLEDVNEIHPSSLDFYLDSDIRFLLHAYGKQRSYLIEIWCSTERRGNFAWTINSLRR